MPKKLIAILIVSLLVFLFYQCNEGYDPKDVEYFQSATSSTAAQDTTTEADTTLNTPNHKLSYKDHAFENGYLFNDNSGWFVVHRWYLNTVDFQTVCSYKNDIVTPSLSLKCKDSSIVLQNQNKIWAFDTYFFDLLNIGFLYSFSDSIIWTKEAEILLETDEYLNNIDMISENDLWITSNKKVYHYQNSNIEEIDIHSSISPTNIYIGNIDMLNNDYGAVVVEDRSLDKLYLYVYDGTDWDEVLFYESENGSSSGYYYLNFIKVVDENTIYFGGRKYENDYKGFLYKYQNSIFSEIQLSPSVFGLNDMVTDGNDGFYILSFQSIFHYKNDVMTEIDFDAPQFLGFEYFMLNSINYIDERHIIAGYLTRWEEVSYRKQSSIPSEGEIESRNPIKEWPVKYPLMMILEDGEITSWTTPKAIVDN